MRLTFNPTSGKFDFVEDLSGYVPYTGATADLNLGSYDLITSGDIDLSNDTSRILIGEGGLTGALGADSILSSTGTLTKLQIESPTGVLSATNPWIEFTYWGYTTGGSTFYMPKIQFGNSFGLLNGLGAVSKGIYCVGYSAGLNSADVFVAPYNFGDGDSTSGSLSYGSGKISINTTNSDLYLAPSGEVRIQSDNKKLTLGAGDDLEAYYDGCSGIFKNIDTTCYDSVGKLQFFGEYTPTSTTSTNTNIYLSAINDLRSGTVPGGASTYKGFEFNSSFQMPAVGAGGETRNYIGSYFSDTLTGNFVSGFPGAWSGNFEQIRFDTLLTGSISTVAGFNTSAFVFNATLTPTALPSSQLLAIKSTIDFNSAASINQLYGWYHTLKMQSTGTSGSMHGFFTALQCASTNHISTDARCYTAYFDSSYSSNFNTALTGSEDKYVGFQAYQASAWSMADRDSYAFHSMLGNNTRNFAFVSDGADGLMLTDSGGWIYGAGKDAKIHFDGSDLIINSLNVTANDEVHFTNFDRITTDSYFKGAYESSDGSAGVTTTFTNGDGDTVTVKDGIITDIS